MSGGSMNYLYRQVEDVAEQLALRARRSAEAQALRVRFAALLRDVATALHHIEWVDSGDYGPGDEIPAIKHALGEEGA